ncbi:hypothetical protein [Allosphingosinicella sp.]|uniref:hypothetical protein n=1 Tax=Allosphingosinicella sp. TaxID=2823234 RepID=UPI00378344D6
MLSPLGKGTQVNQMNRKLITIFAVAAIAVSNAAAQPARTAYQIDVSAPGTKSQGLRGTLYDDQGRRVDEGPTVQTAVGSFRWIPCRMLWESCGRWREGAAPPMSSYPRQNRSVLHYRITVEARGGVTLWSGQLIGLNAGTVRTRPVETAMGVFRWTSGRVGAAEWRGWVP